MGVGKTTVSKLLCKKLPKCVYLDGDWCNFIKCSVFENIIFAWVLHEQGIVDAIVSHLDTDELNIVSVSLVASENILKARLQKDIAAGLRSSDVIDRSIARLPLYENLNTIKIDADNLTAEQVALKILYLTNNNA